MKNRLFVAVVMLFSIFYFCPNIFAVGSAGFKNEVVDAEAMGKGSSFVAQADNPSAVYYNPAGLTQLNGSYVSLGWTAEFPQFEVESPTDGTVQGQKQYFLIPNFYYVTQLNESLRFGFGATAPYGLGTDWAQDSYVSYVSTESDLEFVDINPTLAFKVREDISVGLGLNYFNSHISKHKRLAGSISSDGDFQLKGTDIGYGYNLGVLYQPLQEHRIGLSYRSEVDLTYRGTTTLNNINQGVYPAIFGGADYSTDIKTDLTLPQSIVVGYAYNLNEKWTLEADLEWTDWSCIEQDKVDFPSETDATKLAVLNTGNPAAKDWNDVFSFGMGADYKATDRLELRCGYLYQDTPIPSVSFDTALPDADRHGISLGLGYDFKDFKIDTSYLALFFMDRDVTNDVGSTAGASIDGKYKQVVNLFAVGFTYKY